MKKGHLAIDCGAESARGILGYLEGGRLVTEEICRFSTSPVFIGQGRFLNVAGFYREIVMAMAACREWKDVRLDSVGVDTWGGDFGLLDRNGELLGLPRSYRDQRTEGTDEELEELYPYRERYFVSGLQNLTTDTLHQWYALSKLPENILDRADKALFLGDLLHYFLCGEKQSEMTIASMSGFFDNNRFEWSKEMLERLSMPTSLLPQVVPTGSVLGQTTGPAAKEYDIQGVRVIAPPVHDTAAAMLAAPGRGDDWAFISSGTWTLLGVESDATCISAESRDIRISSARGAFGKTLYHKNVMGLWIIQQCRRAWNRRGLSLDYSEIAVRAGKAIPFFGYIDPDDECFLRPDDAVTEVLECLERTGQRPVAWDDVGQVARIVYESLAMKYRAAFQGLRRGSGKKINRVHMVGGGGKNAFLNQLTASSLGVPVFVGPYEATAVGNLLTQAYGCGELSGLEEIRAIMPNSEIQEFLPCDGELFRAEFQRFQALCNLQLKRVKEKRNG